MRRSLSRIVTSVFATGVVLSACSSTDRMAAPAEEQVVSEQVNESEEATATEQAPQDESESELETSADPETEPESFSEPDAEVEALASSGGGFTPDTKTCPEKSSFTLKRKVTNELPFPIVLTAGDYTCSDWSGVSTPGRAFNNLRLAPGETVTVRLEPADNVKRSWTLAIRREGSDRPLATPRLFIPVAGALGMEESMVRVNGSKQIPAPAGGGKWTDYCDVLELERINEPDTPGSRWDWNFSYDMLSFVVRDGSVTVVSFCVG